ncbi:MAG: DUF1211 domain-containing protein [Bacteroidetes bacterium]|nr:DUF1211 domain-containing protein [Bacteroidota bacterium]
MNIPAKEYTPGTSRIEAFSDGVFAIVVTLLVIEIGVPEMHSGFTTQDLLGALYHMSPKFISFALSFAVIAIFWSNHHQLFHSLEKADRKLLWLNNLLLFWMSFIPFPTAFIGEYPLNIVPVVFYGSVLFFASVSFNLIVTYAAKNEMYYPYISKELIRQGIKRGRFGPVIYFISIISAFISVYISLFIFLLVPVFYFIPQKIVKID